MVGLIFIVLGTMYLGVVTPTEAAALGSLASMILAAGYRRLTWMTLVNAFRDTVGPTSMCLLIITFASIFSHVVAPHRRAQGHLPADSGAGITPLGSLLPKLLIPSFRASGNPEWFEKPGFRVAFRLPGMTISLLAESFGRDFG